MAVNNREAAIKITLGYEGGYTNNPADPGGPTNWGITIADARKYWKVDATAADVKAMPVGVAIDIYRRRYWAPVRGDELPAGVDLVTFDFGVNSGVSRGAKALQRAVKAAVDGVVGTATITAARAADPIATIKAICAERLSFLRGLRIWSTFGKGWGRRVADVEARGVKMALVEAKALDIPNALIGHSDEATKKSRKEATKAGGSAIAGSGSFELPHWLWWAIGIVMAIAVVVFVYHYWIHRQRAAAYAAVAKEA